MKRKSLIGALALCTALGLVACTDLDPTYGGGEFEQLTLERLSGLGFCPGKDAVIRATLAKGSDGTFTLGGLRAVEGDPQTDTCSQLATYEFTCMVEQPFGPITISEEEMATIRAHVAAVPAKECVLDKRLACDPCLVTLITVDAKQESGDCCGTMDEDFSGPFGELVAAIEALAPDAR